MALELNIGANTRKAVSGVEDLGEAMEKVSDALDDTGKDGDKLERSFSENMRDMKSEASRTGSEIGKGIGEGTEEASEGLETMADKGLRGAARIGGSMKGVDDILGGLQRTASTALSGFGPAGMVAGAAAAAGLGLVTAEMQRQQEEAKKSEERISDMYSSFIESKLNYLTAAQKADAIDAITGDKDKREQAIKDAQFLGLTVSQIVAAQVEQGEARIQVQDRINQLQAEAYDAGKRGEEIDSSRIVYLNSMEKKLKDLTGEQLAAVDAAEIYRATVALATGEQVKTNEELQKTNRLIADIPQRVPVKVEFDDSDIVAKLSRPRVITVNARLFARNGQELY